MKHAAHAISTLVFFGIAALASQPVRAETVRSVLDQYPRHYDSATPATRDTPSWDREDIYGQFHGMQRYATGDYKGAMKYFLIGARYADKLSQLSIGLMYLNGEGVQKDPAVAFAWIAVAAERDAPQIVSTRDALWKQLDAQQRRQATAEVAVLYPEYGDATAQRRLANQLRTDGTALNQPKSDLASNR